MANTAISTRIPGVKSYGTVTVSLGLVNVKLAMYPMGKGATKNSSSTGTRHGCPHDNAVVEQFYRCTADASHTDMKSGELAKVFEGNGNAVALDRDEITALKLADVEADTLALGIHPAEQVESVTFFGGTAYTLYPLGPKEKGITSTDKQYSLLVEVIESNPDKAFVGLLCNRNVTKLYRLIVRGGRIVAQALLYPEDMNETIEMEHVELLDKETAMAQTLVEGLTEDFDAETYRHNVRDRIEAAAAEKEGGQVITLPERPAAPADDMVAALEASLAAFKKPAKKATTAKKAAKRAAS